MATNSRGVAAQLASFVVREPIRMRSRACPPSRSVISTSYRSCTLAAPRIRSDRYWDSEAASALSRTSIVTLLACLARCITAWPAELPPPTTQSSSPPHRGASLAPLHAGGADVRAGDHRPAIGKVGPDALVVE